MTTFDEAIRSASERLAEAGVGTPSRDARRIMAHALSVDMGQLTIRLKDECPLEILAGFEALLLRRLAREPVSHILGYRDFWKSRFRVSADVLDPRPETELLVELALQEPFTRVLDVGTGSGAIVISLLLERHLARGVGTDTSPEAVLIAGENAAELGVGDRITLPLSDWFDDVGGCYDLIVSNPPYIPASDVAKLDPEVKDHEPMQALTDGLDGLTGYREIARHGQHLATNGARFLVEIGHDQGAAVSEIFRAAGLEDIRVHHDLGGRDRVVSARKPLKIS